MTDKILAFLDDLRHFFEEIFKKEISKLTVPQLLVIVGLVLLVVVTLKALVKPTKAVVAGTGKVVANVFKKQTIKYKASKATCLHCGRTLDKCVCVDMKDLSLRKRLKKHKLEVKALKLQKKLK